LLVSGGQRQIDENKFVKLILISDYMDMMDLMKPPPTLLDMMGVWASLTGVLGFLANGAAISIFCRSSKVQIFTEN
jgi:hypothetical protein